MGRTNKKGLDYFPEWSPHITTNSQFGNSNSKVRLKALRNSSSAFISRLDVREIILQRDNNKCIWCGIGDNLTLDHIVSVYRVKYYVNHVIPKRIHNGK
jgi:hypothetical protein